MKVMENSPLKELNEMEVSKLSDIELKIMVLRMLKELIDNYQDLSESYNSIKRDVETTNKHQKKMKKTFEKKINKGLQASWMKQNTELVSWKTRWKETSR